MFCDDGFSERVLGLNKMFQGGGGGGGGNNYESI